MTQDTTISFAGDVVPPAAQPASTLPAAVSQNPIRTLTVLSGAGFCMFAAFFLVLSVIPVGSFSTAIAAVNANPNARHINPVQTAAAMSVLNTLTGFLMFLGVLMLIAGVGLLMKKSWGRILAIGASLPLLVNFPFGTAFGIFVMYVMLKRGARENYRLLSAGR